MLRSRFQARSRGAAGQQYAIVVGLIAVVALLGVPQVGGNVNVLFGKVGNTVTAVTNGSTSGSGSGGGQQPAAGVNGLSFTDLINQAQNAPISSNAATLTGFTGSLTASVSGGGSPQLSINGGSFGAGGPISAGQTLRVRLTSSASANQTTMATVSVGTATANFSVTTTATGGPWNFTTCGQTGYGGPSQDQCNSAYPSGNTLSGAVTVSNGIQYWTVPVSGTYRITAVGAAGGPSQVRAPGYGTSMRGDFALTAGTALKILVGQQGAASYYRPQAYDCDGGGGGGSFVTNNSNVPLIIAGGGGGSSYSSGGLNASTGHNGVSACGTGGTGATDGTSGSGGSACSVTDGGAGLTGNGADGGYGGPSSFTNNGAGGRGYPTSSNYSEPFGGFGGGGGGHGECHTGGGGGGGYAGGGAGPSSGGGGGGGSYNSGTNPTNISGAGTGVGSVTFALVGP